METSTAKRSRAYAEKHDFINYTLDLSSAPAELWMQLGEATSKIEHVRGALLKPDTAKKLQQLYMIKGAVATTAIEGNTLTEEQAELLLEGALKLPPSQEYLGREVSNVIDAANAVIHALSVGPFSALSVADICRYDAEILAGLDDVSGEEVRPGKLREHSVVVGNYLAPPAEDVEYLLGGMCSWVNGPDFAPEEMAWKMPLAIVRAIVAHLYVAWIHPFGDGNGRTARLVEFRILLEAGVPLPAATLLSNHYNQTRAAYYNSLSASSRIGPIEFVKYAVEGFVDGLRAQLAAIRDQQFNDRWEQFVYETFGPSTSPTAIRRRRLALGISRAPDAVARPQLRHLTPELAEAYATKTDKTLTRDINALLDLVLIRRTPSGYVSSKEQLEAFRPFAAAE
jgi:Fic family protein